ncbi:hypothetical protein M422DRAFT_70982 [Sphaerobolus stellatus SS14]|uniref:Uncharacterized protein n=1 Tax=Sphaerobolus stellatus (strain SS14) TaxID=990650 RepID=A0A0C9TL57_SPHS4|nr:hypothetical protein M422DRAFT_70982 [Sphaerobolus stellatus SS14]
MYIKSRTHRPSMNPVKFSALPSSKLEDAIKKMLLTAEHAYIECPATRELVKPSFTLEDVEIATKESRSHPSEVIRVKEVIASNQSFGKYFDDLKKAKKLSNTDIQRRAISIKLNLYSNTIEQSEQGSDEEIPVNSGNFKCKKKPINTEKKKACLSSHNSDLLVSRSLCLTLCLPDEARKSALAATTGSVSNVQEASVQAEPEPFIAPYHCQPSFDVSSYDLHAFHRMSCIVTPDGEILLTASDVKELVAVHKDWAANFDKMIGPVGGYLGKGLRKWAFKC